MSFGEAVVVILGVLTIYVIGRYVIVYLWNTGGRNELEIYRDEWEEFERLRKEIFDE